MAISAVTLATTHFLVSMALSTGIISFFDAAAFFLRPAVGASVLNKLGRLFLTMGWQLGLFRRPLQVTMSITCKGLVSAKFNFLYVQVSQMSHWISDMPDQTLLVDATTEGPNICRLFLRICQPNVRN
jgi:hypothetical protein